MEPLFQVLVRFQPQQNSSLVLVLFLYDFKLFVNNFTNSVNIIDDLLSFDVCYGDKYYTVLLLDIVVVISLVLGLSLVVEANNENLRRIHCWRSSFRQSQIGETFSLKRKNYPTSNYFSLKAPPPQIFSDDFPPPQTF